MLSKTEGLVFRSLAYGESSIILHVLTEKLGLQSYLVHNARKSKGPIAPSVFQALHWVEIVAYHKSSGDLHKVKEIKNKPHYEFIPYDLIKSSLILFIDEVLIKSVRQNQKDPALYSFLNHSLFWLDLTQENLANFHILFLLQLSRYLGFFPSVNESGKGFTNTVEYVFSDEIIPLIATTLEKEEGAFYFDLKNGIFLDYKPMHPGYVKSPLSHHIYALCQLNFTGGDHYPLNKELRREILNTLLDYYAFHVENFGQIKSLAVLTQIFE